MTAKNRMSMLETFSSASGVGAGVSQVAIMTDGVLTGSYALATVAFGTNDTVQVLRLLPDGNGNITGLVDLFNKGAASSIFINGTYNVTGNGRTTLTTNVGIGVQTLIFYVASGTESFALGTQPAVEGRMFLQ